MLENFNYIISKNDIHMPMKAPIKWSIPILTGVHKMNVNAVTI